MGSSLLVGLRVVSSGLGLGEVNGSGTELAERGYNKSSNLNTVLIKHTQEIIYTVMYFLYVLKSLATTNK